MSTSIRYTSAHKAFIKPLFILLACILGTPALAGDLTFNGRLDKADIVANATFNITDHTTYAQQANPSNYAISRSNLVKLIYERNEFSDVQGATAWWYEVYYEIYETGTVVSSIPDTLRIEYDNVSKTFVYEDLNVHGSFASAEVKILGVAGTANTPTDIRLDLIIETEQYIYLNPSATQFINFDATNSEIHWSYVEGAEEYDVEWVFIDSTAGVDFSTQTAEAPFNYKDATRVRTPNQKFKIDLTYPTGTLYFRVRPIGRYINNVGSDYSHVKLGDWSYLYDFNPSHVASHEITPANNFERQKNWTYQASFDENGNHKGVLSYFDGSSRGRQVVTNISSDSTVLVAESKYDYEGRAAVSILPVPVEGWDMHYRDSLNLVGTGAGTQPFEKNTFDTLALCATEYATALNETSGAAQYYSSQNTFTDNPFRDYIPDANGHVYTQVQFTRDATGRVARASGLGDSLALGSGHESRMFYGNTNEVELRRLFGSNVGKASHYQKYMSVDANGQVSITYADQGERTIATALAGEAPENLYQLDNYDTQSITADLTGNNVENTTEGELIAENKFLNTVANTTYTFHYDMRGEIFNESLWFGATNDLLDTVEHDICVDCKYDLIFFITDPCGKLVQFTEQNANETTTYINRRIEYDNPSCDSSYYTQADSLQLDIAVQFTDLGEYTVTKKLRVVTENIDDLVEDIMEDAGIDLDTMIAQYQANIDTTLCNTSCEDHCRSIVLEANPNWAAQPTAYATEIDAAIALCVTDSCGGITDLIYEDTLTHFQCSSLYTQMLEQVAPWGDSGNGGHFYLDSTFLVDNNDLLPSPYTTETSEDIIRANWQTGWDSLYVTRHREWCHYTNCLEQTRSRAFDLEMSAIIDWDEAENSGFLDPLKMGDAATGQNVGVNPLTTEDPFVLDAYGLTINTTVYDDLEDRLLYYTQYGALCPESTQTLDVNLWDYTLEADSCLWDSISYNDTTRWERFRSIYFAQKEALRYQYQLTDNCTYYSDPYAIVTEPIDFASDTSAYVDTLINQGMSNFLNCEVNCATNVSYWVSQLDTACYNGLDSTDLSNLSLAMEDYCMAVCNYDNPWGLILADADTNVAEWQYLDSLMTDLGCGLDTIALDSAYSGCDTMTITAPTQCFKSLVEFINDEIIPNYATSTCYEITNHAQLADCYGHASLNGYVMVNATGDILERRHVSGSCGGVDPSDCDLMVLYDEYGNQVNFGTIEHLNIPEYAPSSPLSGVPGTLTFALASIYVDYGDSTNLAYVYQKCQTFIETDTYCVPNGFVWEIPTYNEDSTDCLQFLLEQAEWEAMVAYQNIHDSIASLLLNSAYDRCFESPMAENYTVSYTLTEYNYTLFYYDQAGNLVQTVPPAGVNPIASSDFTDGVWNGTSEPAHTLETRYAYNFANQITESETPDGGLSRVWYNDNYQPRFSQNAEQAAKGFYSYTKYDALGRPIEIGESGDTLAGICSTGDFRSNANDPSYPTIGWEVTNSYYDTVYDTNMAAEFEGGQQNVRPRVSAVVYTPGDRGICTQPANTHPTLASHYSYDAHGNVKELVQENTMLSHLGDQDIKNIKYDYDLVSGNVNQVTYQEGETDQYMHRYKYDVDNRLTSAWTSRDGRLWEQDQKNFYYLHGPLARMETGHDKVQGSDYVYTINGWLKTVNGSTLHTERDMGKDGTSTAVATTLNSNTARDAMAFSLGYYESDYTSIGANNGMLATISGTFSDSIYDLFNGNIGHMTTAMMDETSDADGIATFGNAYRYDQLQRIKAMNVFSHYVGSTDEVRDDNSFAGATVGSNQYATTYAYDANGNLQTLERNNGSGTAMDDFTYHYTANTNQLSHVTDAVVGSAELTDIESQSATNYIYDEIGELIGDVSEEIDSIEWNHYGKIRRVDFSTSSGKDDLEFIYGPGGTRMAKIVGTDYGQEVTYYVRDASGNVMATYNKQFTIVDLPTLEYDEKLRLNDHHIYGTKRLGTDGSSVNIHVRNFTYDTGTQAETTLGNETADFEDMGFFKRAMQEKTYECANHLGNVLVTVNDMKLGVDSVTSGVVDYYLPDVLSYSDYYPFGMQMPGRNAENDYRYAFNGMEHDPEVSGDGNSYTTEFRHYDPRLGRWKSLDPLMASFPHQSPFVAFDNNPIYYIDPYGLSAGGTDDGPKPTKDGGAEGQKASVTFTRYRHPDNVDGLFGCLGDFLEKEITVDYYWHTGSDEYGAGWYSNDDYLAGPGAIIWDIVLMTGENNALGLLSGGLPSPLIDRDAELHVDNWVAGRGNNISPDFYNSFVENNFGYVAGTIRSNTQMASGQVDNVYIEELFVPGLRLIGVGGRFLLVKGVSRALPGSAVNPVFYTEGQALAQEAAVVYEGSSLEMTLSGKFLNWSQHTILWSGFTPGMRHNIWKGASMRMGAKSSGQAYFVPGSKAAALRTNSYYRQVELPAIKLNPNLKDPKTLGVGLF